MLIQIRIYIRIYLILVGCCRCILAIRIYLILVGCCRCMLDVVIGRTAPLRVENNTIDIRITIPSIADHLVLLFDDLSKFELL